MISNIMEDALSNINLEELNLDAPVRKLVQRLLNHIEILTKEVSELGAENQRLRDENARLKGEQGKPEIKANKKVEEKSEAEAKKKEQTKRTINRVVAVFEINKLDRNSKSPRRRPVSRCTDQDHARADGPTKCDSVSFHPVHVR